MKASIASMTQTEAMAFCLLFGDTHSAHHHGDTVGVDDWFVRDNENEIMLFTFEDCLRQLADERDLDLEE